MADDTLSELVTGAASNLPGPAKVTLLKALNRLTGGLIDIPAAVLEGWAQSVRDKTAAKSTISQMLAVSAAKDLTADELTMAAVKQVYVPEVIRKTRNRIEVARRAAEEIDATDVTRLADPDEDWINTFARHAEDASSERLQKLFAKILSGELQRKGSFSTATLRVVSELNQGLAEDFAWAWDQSIGSAILKNESRGDPWVRIRKLRDAGLLSPVDSGVWEPPFNPSLNGASPWGIGDEVRLIIGLTSAGSRFVNVTDFTNVGLELGTLLPKPDYQRNLRELSQRFANSNAAWIVLLDRSSRHQEVLWRAPNWESEVPTFAS